MRAKIEAAWIEVVADEDADASYLEQEDLGFEDRLAAYRRGDFAYVGVRACAEVRFETEQGGWIIGPTVSTPGLWSIEDDSGEQYLREVGNEEAGQLVEMLEALGIDHRRADYARAKAEAGELRYR